MANPHIASATALRPIESFKRTLWSWIWPRHFLAKLLGNASWQRFKTQR
jgi:hypothetical protein